MPIVEAAGGATVNKRARATQDAMAKAVMQCAREGITDPEEIKRRMLAAREKLKRGNA